MALELFIEEVRSLAASGVAEYAENKSLSELSTFKIGGECRIVVYPKNSYALISVIRLASRENIPFAVFGRCSNVLFTDNGFSGCLIVTTKMKGFSRKKNVITAECGLLLNELAKITKTVGFTGGEFMYGIPGTVGGAVCMNAGAYDGCIADIIRSCKYYSIRDDKSYTATKDELDLSYRHSIFSGDSDKIVLEAEFEFETGDKNAISEKMEDFMSRRRQKQPLSYPSAGSVFKRPEGYFAAKLIDDCGLKGRMAGGAMVSVKHAGFIINYDNATSKDVCYLINVIKNKVNEEYGVELQTEIIMFGDPDTEN